MYRTASCDLGFCLFFCFFWGGVVNFLLFCFFYFVALSFRWLKCFSIDNQSHCGNRKYIFAVLIVQKKFSLTIHWMPNLFKIKPLHPYIWYVIATYQKQKHEEYYFNNHKLLNATRPTEYLPHVSVGPCVSSCFSFSKTCTAAWPLSDDYTAPAPRYLKQ